VNLHKSSPKRRQFGIENLIFSKFSTFCCARFRAQGGGIVSLELKVESGKLKMNEENRRRRFSFVQTLFAQQKATLTLADSRGRLSLRLPIHYSLFTIH